jgi:hypothetical protein
MGPLEFVVIGFDGNHFTGEIMPEIRALRETGTIRILDLLFLKKDAAGTTQAIELTDLPEVEFQELGEIEYDEDGWFSVEDVSKVGESLPENSSVAMLLFEHAWASRLADTVRRAQGRLIYDERIPVSIVEEVEAAKTTSVTGPRE